jgi:integrase
MFMLGFAAALRRSELIAVSVEDIEKVEAGIVLTLRRSKTDQEGAGQRVAVPFGPRTFCPIRALEKWLAAANIEEGPVFRRIDRFGCIGARALNAASVGPILCKRLSASGIQPEGFSAHSLRAGLVTSAAMAGVPSWKIRQQTRHRSDLTLATYIRDHQIFTNNASAAVFFRQ